jgi:hypothetical protein
MLLDHMLSIQEKTQMPTDYVLFNHGVNTREARPNAQYADALFKLIQQHYNQAPARTLKKVALYWGDVNQDQEQLLLKAYRDSSIWDQLWFRQLRENQFMQFIGDGALYISRLGGSKIADALEMQMTTGLQGFDPKEDRLHIVTHSMGTVILFDMLFTARWDPDDAPGHASVTAMRKELFGVYPNPAQGIRIGSISTMGSPIGFFSLMNADQSMVNAKDNASSTHDISTGLEQLLDSLYQELGRKLPWYNFAHPGDPIAYPLEKLLPQLVDGRKRYIDVQDILTHPTTLTDLLSEPFSQSLFALLHGGEAHNSYWQSDQVAKMIAQAIDRALQAPTAFDKAA